MSKHALETLKSDAAFLRHYLANYVVHVPVKDTRDHIINGFAAVQIPDWAVRQRLDDIDFAIAQLAEPEPEPDTEAHLGDWTEGDGTPDHRRPA